MTDVVRVSVNDLVLEVRDDPTYRFGSADNSTRYERELILGDPRFRTSSQHGVQCRRGDEVLGSVILGANGGASAVHGRSIVVVGNLCFVAVGPYVVALSVPDLAVSWSQQVDHATCFGVLVTPDGASLISHGELEISRVDLSGRILWQSGGADIFTGELKLSDRVVHVDDFEGRSYSFDIETGRGRQT
jgi:hypothetical protein